MYERSRWSWLVGVVVAACTPERPPPAVPSKHLVQVSAPESPPPPPAPPVPAVDGGGAGVVLPRLYDHVSLIDAGAEPRRDVRHAPAPGSIETVDFRVDRGADGDSIHGAIQVEILSATPHWIAYRARFVSAYTEPRSTGDKNRLNNVSPYDLVGAHVAGVIDARGVPYETRFFGSSAAHQVFVGLGFELPGTVPLPSSAIGVGARWERVSRVCCYNRQFEFPVESVATYVLTELSGDRLAVDANIAHRSTATDRVVVSSESARMRGSLAVDRLTATLDEQTDLVLDSPATRGGRPLHVEIHQVVERRAR
jgi:hypothetical protein